MLNGAFAKSYLNHALVSRQAYRKHSEFLRSDYSSCLHLDSVDWTEERTRGFGLGTAWVALTVAFEFLAGHYVSGNGWERLFADYNVFRGRIWILVLVAKLLAPLWAFLQKQPVE